MEFIGKKLLLITLIIVIVSGIIVIQNLPKNERWGYIYLDDVSISIDGVIVFQDDIRNETASEKWKTIEYAHTTDEVYHSPPSSFALRCAESEKGEYGTLYPRITINPEWSKLNVTWFVKIPKEALLGSETRQDLSLFFMERGEGRLRLGCVIRLSDKSNNIWASAVYFGDQVPPIFDDEQEVDFDFTSWHRLMLVLEKPRVIVYFDDTIVCDFPIFIEYIAKEIDLRWWAYYHTT